MMKLVAGGDCSVPHSNLHVLSWSAAGKLADTGSRPRCPRGADQQLSAWGRQGQASTAVSFRLPSRLPVVA